MLFFLYPTTLTWVKELLTRATLVPQVPCLFNAGQARQLYAHSHRGNEREMASCCCQHLHVASWIQTLISIALWAHKWDDFTFFFPSERWHYRNIRRLELMTIWPEIKLFSPKGLPPVSPQVKWIKVHHRYYRGELPICWIPGNFWVSICGRKYSSQH